MAAKVDCVHECRLEMIEHTRHDHGVDEVTSELLAEVKTAMVTK